LEIRDFLIEFKGTSGSNAKATKSASFLKTTEIMSKKLKAVFHNEKNQSTVSAQFKMTANKPTL